MAWKHVVLAAVAAGALGSVAVAAAAERTLAPIPQDQAVSTHGPFEMGECNICHQGTAQKPGKILKAGNDLCFDCHEEFKAVVKNHPSSKGACTLCHSPHNARKRKLLR